MFLDSQYIIEKVKSTTPNPLFVVIGGKRMTGIYLRETPYVVTGCYLGEESKHNGTRQENVSKEGGLSHHSTRMVAPLIWEIQELNYYIERLKNLDLSAIEEIHSPIVIIETEHHEKLKKLSRKLFTKQLFSCLMDRIDRETRILNEQAQRLNSTILELARNYMLGIYIFRLQKFHPSIVRLNEYFGFPEFNRLLNEMNHRNEDIFFGDDRKIDEIISQLREDFYSAFKYTRLPDKMEESEEFWNEFIKEIKK